MHSRVELRPAFVLVRRRGPSWFVTTAVAPQLRTPLRSWHENTPSGRPRAAYLAFAHRHHVVPGIDVQNFSGNAGCEIGTEEGCGLTDLFYGDTAT